MQTMTRTRRPFRAAITENGLVPTKRCEVLAHHGYYFGGSSSPSFVLVLAVTDDYVTYCDARRLESRREQRWVFEDLASRAGETMRKAAEQAEKDAATADTSKAWGRLAVQGAKLAEERVAMHGALVNLESYDRVRVELVAGEGVDVYSCAGSLGVIVSCDSDARTAVVECSQIDFNDYARRVFASGERFDLVLTVVATVKECPRG
jgi:hypothetical protein